MDFNLLEGPSFDDCDIINSSLGERYFNTLDKNSDEINQACGSTGITETYSSVKRRAILVAMEMQRIKIKENDIILISCKARLEESIIMLATFFMGAQMLFIDPEQDLAEFLELLEKVNPRAAFCDQRVAAIIVRACTQENFHMYIFGKETSSSLKLIYDKHLDPNFKPVHISEPKTKTAVIIITEGVTESPKLIRISHYAILYRCKILLENIFENCRKVISFFPLCGTSRILLQCVSFENKLVRVLPKTYNPRDICKTIFDFNIDCAVLGTYHALEVANYYSDEQDYNLLCLKLIVIGGTVTSKRALNCILTTMGKKIINLYLSAECGIIAGKLYSEETRIDDFMLKSASCGKLYPGVTVRLLDLRKGDYIGPDKWGEIIVSSSALATGYLEPSNQTKFLSNGFFKTGDLGQYDSKGDFYIHSRVEDVIIHKDKMFSTIDVEDALYLHPNVMDVTAFISSKNVIAYCILDDASITTKDLFKFLIEQLSKHMLPQKIYVLNDIPKSQNGKVKKYILSQIISRKSFFDY